MDESKPNQLYLYNSNSLEIREYNAQFVRKSDEQMWLNFYGFDQTELIDQSFSDFQIHRLTQEDIKELVERPKVEEYENYIYITLKTILLENGTHRINTDQISFVLIDNGLISYQEKRGDFFDEIRTRITKNKGIVRSRECDYLLYLLLSCCMEGYDAALEKITQYSSTVRKQLNENLTSDVVQKSEDLKDTLRDLKKSLHPFREQINNLINSDHVLIDTRTKPYFNDLRDNLLYVSDEIESIKNDLDALSNLYFAKISQRSNEIMQFLTIVAAIFIPLTFIAGIYGMNFVNMPELREKNGYFFVLGVMVFVALGLIIYFKKKKWF